LKKFPLSCNSLKCLLQAKKFIRENSTKKNLLLRKQTSPTNAFNWVVRSLSQSAFGKFFLAVKFTHKSPEHPCVLQCTQFCSSVFLEAGLAKWGRRKRIRTLEWLCKENKQKKVRWNKCAWMIFQWISMSPTIHRYWTQQRSHCNNRCYRCQVPKFLQNLSLLLTQSFCLLVTIAIASSARPIFTSSLRDVFHSFFAVFTFSNWSTEFSVVHAYL